jgi:hypothetical protein
MRRSTERTLRILWIIRHALLRSHRARARGKMTRPGARSSSGVSCIVALLAVLPGHGNSRHIGICQEVFPYRENLPIRVFPTDVSNGVWTAWRQSVRRPQYHGSVMLSFRLVSVSAHFCCLLAMESRPGMGPCSARSGREFFPVSLSERLGERFTSPTARSSAEAGALSATAQAA